MSRSAGDAVDIDEGRLSTPQRALVLLTFLLVVAALALFALQGLGGDKSAGRRRVTAAPTTPSTAPTTTAPTTIPAASDSSPGATAGRTGPNAGSPAPQTPDTGTGAGEPAAPPPSADPTPAEATASAPAPPPAAWYVSFHGGDPTDPNAVNNVLAYDANGVLIPTPVLAPGATGLPLDLRELRVMAFGSDGTLYVVNSYQGDSKVLVFSSAVGPDGTRALVGEFSHGYPPNAANPGIQHPYGLAFDGSANVLVSSQDSQVVTRLFGPTASPPNTPGTPTATASSWCANPCTKYYAGTFAPGDHAPAQPPPPPSTVSSHDGGLRSPRAVVYDSGNNTVYVADNTDSSVKAYDGATGSFTGAGKGRVITSADGLSDPVGMVLHNGILYVADEGSDRVLALDLITPGAKPQVVVDKTEGGVTLENPSGLAFGSDDALYVASRKGKQVVRYELSGDGVKAKKAKVFLDHLPDQPEHIVAVPG